VIVPLVFLADFTDPDPGRWAKLGRWWPGPLVRPDSPGWARRSPVGPHVAGDSAVGALAAIRDLGVPALVGGHRHGGAGAEIVACTGRAAGVVLVDGLGDPYLEPDASLEFLSGWLGSVLRADTQPTPDSDGPDPIRRHGPPMAAGRLESEARRKATTIPVIAIESPSSPISLAEAERRLAGYAGPADLRVVGDDSPDTIGSELAALASAAAEWTGRRLGHHL
jgi:hypothetical protein